MLAFLQLLVAGATFFVAGMHYATLDQGAPRLNAWSWITILVCLGLWNILNAIGNCV